MSENHKKLFSQVCGGKGDTHNCCCTYAAVLTFVFRMLHLVNLSTARIMSFLVTKCCFLFLLRRGLCGRAVKNFNSFENINQTESSDQTLIQVKMYPNPTTSTSTIKWDLNEEMTLTVVDVRGVIVHQLSISPEMRITTIDLQNNGVYFLRLEKDGQPKWNGKLVKI